MPTEPSSTPEPTEVTAEPELSLAEHEAQFGEASKAPEASPPARAGESDDAPSDAPSSTTTERDASGKFIKTRQRARSQGAGQDDVAEISAQTKRIRDAEAALGIEQKPGESARVFELRRRAEIAEGFRAARQTATTRPAEPPRAQVAAPARPEAAPAVGPPAKPKIDDFQDYGEYVEALADYKIAEARIKDRETAQHEAEGQRLASSWRERTEAAKTTYTDFEAVALQAPTAIPPGSLVDAWILEHKSGAHVLYHLQKHPDVLSSLLAMPLFDQVDALSLLAQRLTPGAPSPVATGVSATPHSSTPRPPTPVRTGSVRATHEPPGEEASLDEFEGFYGGPSARS